VVVGGVDAEEGDLLAALDGLALEERELEAARTAPRRPLVDDDRPAAQRVEAAVEGGAAAAEQLGGLVVQRRERRGRALELRAGAVEVEAVRGGLTGVAARAAVAAAGRLHEADDHHGGQRQYRNESCETPHDAPEVGR
jgi:hypothetical protein